MKTRMSTLIFFAAAALLVWYHHLDPSGVILSDVPNDPNVTQGWPWLVGAIGILMIPAGFITRSSENERTRAARRKRVIRQETERRQNRNMVNNLIRVSAETGQPQYIR